MLLVVMGFSSACSLKPPHLLFSLLQIAFPASYCGRARGSTDYLFNPVNPSPHQPGMILTIIVFAAASIRKKQGSGEMRWNETSQRISGRDSHVSELCVCACEGANQSSRPWKEVQLGSPLWVKQ